MFVYSGPIKRISNRHRPLMIIGLALLAVLLAISPGWAVESQSGDQVIIGPDEVVDDDLYATATRPSWRARSGVTLWPLGETSP